VPEESATLARHDRGDVGAVCRELRDGLLRAGDKVTLGGHVWRVLEVKGRSYRIGAPPRALLLADRITEFRPYHDEWVATSWADCSLRRWLNHEFLEELPPDFAGRIRPVAVTTPDNPVWGTAGGPDTTDRVFLLSIQEAVQYLAGNPKVKWKDYKNYDRWFQHDGLVARYGRDNRAWWWLRSPGNDPDLAAYVYTDGHLNGYGDFVAAAGGGVRPALWLNLESSAA
jgi:hypothetical protein